jgi:hypothetical protein
MSSDEKHFRHNHKQISVPGDIPRVLTMKLRPTPWIIEKWLVEDAFHIFSGEPGCMKSMLALFLASRISNGTEVFGGNPKKKKVIYLDKENPVDVVRDRYELFGIETEENLDYWGMWTYYDQPPNLANRGSDNPEARAKLLKWAEEHRPVMIFDSLIAFHDREENSASEMRDVMRFFGELRFRGATVIVLHHQGKPVLEGTRSPYRGSSEIAGACDLAFNIKMRQDGEMPMITATSFKNRFDLQIQHNLRFDGKKGLFIPFNAEDEVDEMWTTQIQAFIEDHPGASIEEVKKEVAQLGEGKLRKLLDQNDGQLWSKRTGAHGKFFYFPLTDGKPPEQTEVEEGA